MGQRPPDVEAPDRRNKRPQPNPQHNCYIFPKSKHIMTAGELLAPGYLARSRPVSTSGRSAPIRRQDRRAIAAESQATKRGSSPQRAPGARPERVSYGTLSHLDIERSSYGQTGALMEAGRYPHGARAALVHADATANAPRLTEPWTSYASF